MDKTIIFPHLGLTFDNVGKSFFIFGFEIAYYGIVVVSAMIIGLLIMNVEAKRLKEDPEKYLDMGMIALIAGIVGARLYFVVFNWDQYKDNLLDIFNTRSGGLAIYGGIIGACIAMYVFCRVKKMSFSIMVDCVAPGLAVGQIIGRWGNFFNREAFGGYTDSLLAMQLPVSAVRKSELTQQMWDHVQTIGGVEFIQVHPTFLYEGLWNLGVFLGLWFYRKHKRFNGEVFLLYLVLYGVGRFWIEGLRTDQLLIPGVGLPVSQVLSGCLVVGAAIKIFYQRKKNRNSTKTQDVVGE